MENRAQKGMSHAQASVALIAAGIVSAIVGYYLFQTDAARATTTALGLVSVVVGVLIFRPPGRPMAS